MCVAAAQGNAIEIEAESPKCIEGVRPDLKRIAGAAGIAKGLKSVESHISYLICQRIFLFYTFINLCNAIYPISRQIFLE